MKNDPLHCRNIHLLALQGIENFRDIGGYQTSDGQSLKWGKVFRSGHLMLMTAMDGESLNLLAINGIFDLRTEVERDSFPTAWQCSLQPSIFTIDVHGSDEDSKADLFQLILAGEISGEQVHAHMVADYARMPFQFVPILKQLCRHLIMSKDATAVVHCTAGKDRTGLVIALLQSLLGVSLESIYEDYLLSNEGFSSREKLEHMVATFGHKVEHIDLCMDALRPLISVDKVYLNAAFGAIDEAHGSVQNYFETMLDISKDQQQMLRDNLLQTA